MQTHEIMAENIACVEKVDDENRIHRDYHAIYFLSPVIHILKNILKSHFFPCVCVSQILKSVAGTVL